MPINLKKIFFLLLIIVVFYKIYELFFDNLYNVPDGIIAPNEPSQTKISQARPFIFKDYTLTPVADFEFEARLIAKKNYNFDKESELSPIDLGISWGQMSDTKILDEFTFSQSNRFLNYRYDNELPLPIDELNSSVANVHVIPANDITLKKIAKYKIGSVIHLKGQLVNVSSNHFNWQTSTIREDTGSGACEVMYVELAY